MARDERVLHVHLPQPLLGRALVGEAVLGRALRDAVEPSGWRIELRENSEVERLLSLARPGWTLLHGQEPPGPRALCLRHAYLHLFWRIERSHERWRFDVARAAFDPEGVDPAEAARLVARWRDRLLPPEALEVRPSRDGFVLAPLQGLLLRHRSFQSMSPLAMLEAALDADPRPIRATLHPREAYAPAEVEAVEALARRVPRLTVSRGGSGALLAACDHVVTQNSATAFRGFAMGKRAVLFAGIDFHHVAGSVPRDGLAAAWASLDGPEPAFERYLFWFLRRHAVNVGAADAGERLRARLRQHGVPL